MRPASVRLSAFFPVFALLGLAAIALPACGDDTAPPLTKKGTNSKGGEGGSAGSGSGGAPTKVERVFEVAGACTDRRMPITIDGQTYPIDCDIWRGPNAVYRVFDALDKCCSVSDKENELYPTFTPQGKLVYEIIAVLHQQDADADLLTVDLAGTVACETAVNAALPKLKECQGGVDVNAVLAACASLVFGKVAEGGKCPDTDTCISPASCLGANSNTKVKGTCTAPGGANAKCTNTLADPKNGTPQHPLCAPGFVCAESRCVAQGADGADCTYALSCLSGRCAAKKCAPALPAKVPLAGSCAGPGDCEDKLRCVGGVCEDRYGEGATCAPQGDDCRVFCDGGKCSGIFCGIDRF